MSNLELYQKAKESYYAGSPIMSDLEFDQLEKSLGLENKSYIGTVSNHIKYTKKHPFLMGSLSKVQIKEDENKNINWEQFTKETHTYLDKANSEFIVCTLKYDGVSFEIVLTHNGNYQVSTRGDGEYGKDLTALFTEYKKDFPNEWSDFDTIAKKYLTDDTNLIIRGEILIDKNKFSKNHPDFTNPRSFVAGIVGQDWEGNELQKQYVKEISLITYDYRLYNKNNNSYQELDWYTADSEIKKYHIGNFASPIYHLNTNYSTVEFINLYYQFNDLRNKCKFMIDGIVLKPNAEDRLYDPNRKRPEDCVAIKFLPEIVETEILNIEWNLGKTGEYFPKAICNEVILGDKKVTKASLHNYSFVKENKVSIGSKIKLSLAGDIIPFVYKVETSGNGEQNIPENSKISIEAISNVEHLIIKEINLKDKALLELKASITSLTINGIADKTAEKLFNIFYEKCKLNNILLLMNEDYYKIILQELGKCKSSENIILALKNKRKTLTLKEIIKSFNFKWCGEKASEQCAYIFNDQEYDISGLPEESYKWAFNKLSDEYQKVQNIKNYLNFEDKIIIKEDNSNKIKIIMTGSPKDYGYKTKTEFLNKHPEYIETTKWEECQILFTDDLGSESSKMKKAKKLNISIKTY